MQKWKCNTNITGTFKKEEDYMRQILMANAFEAWTAAIRYCNDIKNGKATIQYQKNFVSSLHNAVELIMKQMLLNNNDHNVAEIRKPKTKSDAKLLLKYFESTNLNNFFDSLSDDELSKFYTIQFNDLISLHKKLFGESLAKKESLETELKLLQKLRNDETHFMIHQSSFLSEKDFQTLHNFMIRFYKIMKTWFPINNDDLELSIFYYWEWFNIDNEEYAYVFDDEPLEKFTYIDAVKNSKLAQDIAEILKGDYQYGAPDFSPYTIAKDLIDGYTGISAQFNEVLVMVQMMLWLKIITITDELDYE